MPITPSIKSLSAVVNIPIIHLPLAFSQLNTYCIGMKIIAVMLLLFVVGCYSSPPPLAYYPSAVPAPDYTCTNFGKYITNCRPNNSYGGTVPEYSCYRYSKYTTSCSPY